MDTLHNSFTIARSAILTHQRRLGIISNNIANINTPGYHRQRAALATGPEVAPTMSETRQFSLGTGVRITDVIRSYNHMQETMLRQQTGDAEGHKTRADALGQLEALLNETGDAALGARLDAFWSAWYDLANQADNMGFRNVVAQRAHELASHIQSLDSRIGNYAEQILNGIPGDFSGRLPADVDRFNELTSELQNMNSRINYSLQAFQPNGLMDKRDAALRELCSMADVTVDVDGAISLDGNLLVAADGGSRAELTVSAAGPPPEFELDGAPVSISSGTLGGWSVVLDIAAGMRDRLDLLTVSLMDAVNTIHNSDLNPAGDSYDLDGERSVLDFFTGTGAGDFAINPAIYDPADPLAMDVRLIAAAASRHAAGPPPVPNQGDGARALEIAELANEAMAALNGQTFNSFHNIGLSMLGGTVASENALAENGNDIVEALKDAIQAETGVNLDEELMEMVSAQRAFQAAARLMNTVDEMITTVLQLR